MTIYKCSTATGQTLIPWDFMATIQMLPQLLSHEKKRFPEESRRNSKTALETAGIGTPRSLCRDSCYNSSDLSHQRSKTDPNKNGPLMQIAPGLLGLDLP